MKNKALWSILFLIVLGLVLVAGSVPQAQAADTVTLKVLNPQGDVPVVNKFAPRLTTLDGKTVAFWLMLPNTFEFQPAGQAFFDRTAELLKKQYPNVKIVSYDKFFSDPEKDKAVASLQEAKPDAVILGMAG